MNCFGVLEITPIDGTNISISINLHPGKSKFIKKSQALKSIFLSLQPQQVVTVGRSRSKTVFINNPTVSINHAIIWSVQFEEESSPVVYIHDTSRNAILHNGLEMGNGVTAVLNDQDTIEIQTAARITFKCTTEGLISLTEVNQPIEDWEITTKLIGSGSFGSVFVAKKIGSPKLYAVKIIQKNRSSYFQDNEVNYESGLLKNIQHPNIIKIYDTIVRNSSVYIFQNLVCGGDLFSYLVCDGYLRAIPEKEAIFIVYQLMKALLYLHKKMKIAHRDIKLDNVLLELPIPQSKIYLCDFGIAKYLGRKKTKTCVGTLEYSAPEVFESDCTGKRSVKAYDFKCDMWSLGVITHILLSGISPFYSDERESIINATRRGKLNFEKPQFRKVSLSGKSFVRQLLQVDPNNRMDIEQAFEHVWIKLNWLKLKKFYCEKIQ